MSDSEARTLITTVFIPQLSISVVGSIMVTGRLLTILVIIGIMFARRCRSFQVSFGPGTEENSPLIVECPEDSSPEIEVNSQPPNDNSLCPQIDPASLIAHGEGLRV